MTALNTDYLNLNQSSGLVELFQIDMTKRGGSVVYVTPHGTATGTVIHNGLTYTSLPMALSKSKVGTTGTMPQPQLSVAVTGNPLLRAAIATYGDLAGCTVKKFHTFAKYLDAANTARVNLVDWSQDLSNAAWVKSASSVVSNATTAPDGTMTADLLRDDATTAQHYISKNTVGTLVASDPVNVSCYVKYAGIQYILIYMSASSTSMLGGGCVVDTIAGTIVAANNSAAVSNALITDAGNGWFRVSFTVPANSSTSTVRAYLNTSSSPSSPSYLGTGTNGVYLWGYQVQRQTNATVDASLMTPQGATLTLNQATQTDPTGGLTADVLAENTATSTHYASQSVAGFVAGQEVNFTIYLKAGGTRNQAMVRFLASTALPTTAYCFIDLTNGAVSSATGLSRTPTVVAMTGASAGWYRLTISVITTADGALVPAVMISVAGNNTYLGAGFGIYMWNGCLTWNTALLPYQMTTTTHAPYADASATSAVESYIINQMVDFNPETVTWKLVTPIDRPNTLIPRLQYLKDDIGESATPPRCVYAPGLNRIME